MCHTTHNVYVAHREQLQSLYNKLVISSTNIMSYTKYSAYCCLISFATSGLEKKIPAMFSRCLFRFNVMFFSKYDYYYTVVSVLQYKKS